MNPQIRKELRVLGPAWIAALAAASMPLWLQKDYSGVSLPCFAVAILFLGLASFGQEMSCGTFGLLLAQPANRLRLWRIKAGLLVLALASAWGLLALCWWILRDSFFIKSDDDLGQMLMWTWLLTCLAFSGGLWTTLLLRDLTTAFCATLLAPGILCAATLLALSHWIGADEDGLRTLSIMYSVLAVYSAAGVVLARRLFLSAQDVPWAGGQISLSSAQVWRGQSLAFGFKERRSPWAALVQKELQLQQVTFLLVPLMVSLHLVSLAARHFNPDLEPKLQISSMIQILWMALPLVVGCVAVAEERRFNTLESSLCLPLRKRSQFLVKLAVVLALGTVLGGFLPSLMESIGRAMGMKRSFIALDSPWLVAAAITGIAFFASTISRNMLQALLAAICIPALVLMAGAFYLEYIFDREVLQRGGAIFPCLVFPTLLLASLWLAWRNYQCLQVGTRVWLGNFTRLNAVYVVAMLAATGLFNRSWEYLLPREPNHGPARITGAGPAKIGASLAGCFALLPDGRLWVARAKRPVAKEESLFSLWQDMASGFVDGSDWSGLAVTHHSGAFAVKSDGTLWNILNKPSPSQIGSASDWKKIVAGPNWFLGLKQDGTLWGWGDDQNEVLGGISQKKAKAIDAANPIRVWSDSIWVDVYVTQWEDAIGVKPDGSTWKWGNITSKPDGSINKQPADRKLVRWSLEGTNWTSVTEVGSGNSRWGWTRDYLTLGARTDGSLWAAGNIHATIFGAAPSLRPQVPAQRIGSKSDWVSVASGWSELVGLEADGTIHRSDWREGEDRPPSKYADWLAATVVYDLTWGLARDGTLCCWRDASKYEVDEYPTFLGTFQLRPSHRPALALNIFDAK